MWKTHRYQGFKFKCKTMAFHFSCFPCCMQIILTNMGLYREVDIIENNWNRMQIDRKNIGLAVEAPNEKDVTRNCLTDHTLARGLGALHLPSSFDSVQGSLLAHSNIFNNFFTNPSYKGMIIGIAHATLIYKLSDDLYCYFCPSPNQSCLEEDVIFLNKRDMKSSVVGGDGQYAIKLSGPGNTYLRQGRTNKFSIGPADLVQAGNFIAIL